MWQALAGLIGLLLVAVVGLDQWQSRHGEPSLFGLPWPAPRGAPSPATEPRRMVPVRTAAPAAPPGSRVAVVVDQVDARREVLQAFRDLGRPVALAVLPVAGAASIARDAARGGAEVLLDLPMEPYGYPRLDPGPGALLMSMPQDEIRRLVTRHLDGLPGVVGVTNYMGSRLTEDRARMRAILEVLVARRLFFVDAYASNLSVAYDEASNVGVRAGRRHRRVDGALGEARERASWDEVGRWAEQRGDAIVFAPAEPLSARLLREYASRWEARGVRVVPVSELVR